MEDVIARKLHTGSFFKTLSIANDAVVFALLAQSELRFLLYALFIETGQALLFVVEAQTDMTTRLDLVTTLVHQLNALCIPAHVDESRLERSRCTHHLLLTEPALPGFLELLELFTSLA